MPIYHNDSVLLYVGNTKGFEDYIKQAELKEMEQEANTQHNVNKQLMPTNTKND